MPEPYTDWCEHVLDYCPGGPEECLAIPQPTDPEICHALEGEGGGGGEGEPPGGPG